MKMRKEQTKQNEDEMRKNKLKFENDDWKFQN